MEISQVAVASEEQSSTAEEVSRNIDSINTVVSETASGIEQVAQAATDLNAMAEELRTLISQFSFSKEKGLAKYN
ncbi:MAG: hypothetical protein JEY94_07850 [Melioribacteraceae bacterium]|nr:hypothetical protein [Melioribacteraceae bacterium]